MTFFHSLTHKEQESFQAYRSGTTNNSSFSYDLNHKLKSSEQTPKRFQLHLQHLDNLTLKAKLSSEVILHRACYGDGIQPLLQGGEYKGFLAGLDKNNCLGRYFNKHHKSVIG